MVLQGKMCAARGARERVVSRCRTISCVSGRARSCSELGLVVPEANVSAVGCSRPLLGRVPVRIRLLSAAALGRFLRHTCRRGRVRITTCTVIGDARRDSSIAPLPGNGAPRNDPLRVIRRASSSRPPRAFHTTIPPRHRSHRHPSHRSRDATGCRLDRAVPVRCSRVESGAAGAGASGPARQRVCAGEHAAADRGHLPHGEPGAGCREPGGGRSDVAAAIAGAGRAAGPARPFPADAGGDRGGVRSLALAGALSRLPGRDVPAGEERNRAGGIPAGEARRSHRGLGRGLPDVDGWTDTG